MREVGPEVSDLQHPDVEGPDPAMTRAISLLLIVGVVTSAVVIAVGLLLVVVTGQTGYHDVVNLNLVLGREGSVAFPTTIGGVVQGAIQLRPFAVIELGTLLLIATPVFRVAASVLLFLLERDYLYTVITLLVLGLLLFSIFFVGQG